MTPSRDTGLPATQPHGGRVLPFRRPAGKPPARARRALDAELERLVALFSGEGDPEDPPSAA